MRRLVVGGVLPTCRLDTSWDIAASWELKENDKVSSRKATREQCDETI